jgi:hypothetical protein
MFASLALAGSLAPAQSFVQTNYDQPQYVQPAPQPTYIQPAASQPTYVAQPTYVQTAYAMQPTYVAQPVVATYASPVYRPVVQTYVAYGAAATPVYAAGRAPVMRDPRVIVHPKVYVAGHPVRNLLTAITP